VRVLALSALLIAAAPAQHVLAPRIASHAPIVCDQRGLVLPAGSIGALELVDATARFLCRNYLYDAEALGELAGFDLQRSLALDALGAEEVLYGLLAARGFAVLPIDELRGLFEIVALLPRSMPLATVPWRLPDEVLLRPRLRELVTTAVTLLHLDANAFAAQLRTHFALQGAWQPGLPTAAALGPRTLVLHGFRDQLVEPIAVARRLDAAVASALPATDTAAILQRLQVLEAEVAALRAALARTR
jgi:hypothetical protein